MVLIPIDDSLSVALGPIPFTFLTGSGHIREGISSTPRMVSPSGFSRSEQIFDSNLLGLRPIEQDSPVASRTDCLIRRASGRVSSGCCVRSI